MNWVEYILFFYMFVGLYMLFLLIFLYVPNRHKLFEYPKSRAEPVSIIVPCFNEGKHIGKTIESLLNLDYPNGMIEIIIVDDKSNDNSIEVIRRYVDRHKNVRLIINKRNSGGAAEPTNIGIKAAKYNYVAVADADSTPERDALRKMIGFLQNDEKVGGVTCAVLAREPNKFIQKLQAIEYIVISWSRKLLDLVNSVYVTPGPFALYKKKVLIEIGLFDTKNMTQDIEIVWRMNEHGYKARMCLATRVYSSTPDSFRKWFKQRIRWNIGGTQTLLKYKKYLFKKEMLGAFIIPYFSVSLFLGLVGLSIFAYLITKRVLLAYLAAHYSLTADSSLLYLDDLTIAPSILNFFGAAMFLAGATFTFTALGIMKYEKFRKGNIFNILFYMILYLSIYPVIMATALVKFIRGNYSW